MRTTIKAVRETIGMMDNLSAQKQLLADALHHRFIPTEIGQSFFNTCPILFCIADFNGHILDFNEPMWLAKLGYKESELRQEFINLVHPADVPKTKAMYEHIKRGGTCEDWPNRYLTAWGHYVQMNWFCAAVDGAIVCTVYVTDIK